MTCWTGFAEFMTSTDHVEFYWFPHTDRCLTKRNTRVPLEAGLAPLTRWRAVWEDEVLVQRRLRGHGRGRAPAAGPGPAAGRASPPGRSAARTWTDASHRVFVSRRRVRFVEMEYAVPRDDAPAVLTELHRIAAAGECQASFPVEVRVAAADDIPLSTASGRDTAYIAAHVPARTDPGSWFAALESLAGERRRPAALGEAARPGRRRRCATRYPRFDEFTALRARLDPAGVLGNAHLDRVLGPVAG